MSKQIVFFGNERLATGVTTQAHIFSSLVESGYQIKALIVSQKLDKDIEKLEVVKAARSHDIEVKSYPNLKQSAQDIANLGVDVAVLAAYGKIVPQQVLDLFKLGIINIHPSLLPKHRGPTPIESAILNGDTESGVSIMRLASSMDAGPLYKQQTIKLRGDETKQELVDRLDELGKDTLLGSLQDILGGNLQPVEQDSSKATYDKLITKQDGSIDWNQPWDLIERKIRAYSGWPRTRFSLSGIDIILIKAHFVDSQKGQPGRPIDFEGSLGIYCKDGLAVIDQLIPGSGKQMSGNSFLLGYRQRVLN